MQDKIKVTWHKFSTPEWPWTPVVRSLLQRESLLVRSLELIYSLVSVSVGPQINNWSDFTSVGTIGFIHENAGEIVFVGWGCKVLIWKMAHSKPIYSGLKRAKTATMAESGQKSLFEGRTNSQRSALEISPKRLKKLCSCSEPGNAQREEGADQFEKTETRLCTSRCRSHHSTA